MDSTSSYLTVTFVDAFSGYHQIKMRTEDRIHTSFRAAGGLYCYKVMPFGLKNAEVTYKRMMDKVFQNQIGQKVELYVDDMVVKTRKDK